MDISILGVLSSMGWERDSDREREMDRKKQRDSDRESGSIV